MAASRRGPRPWRDRTEAPIDDRFSFSHWIVQGQPPGEGRWLARCAARFRDRRLGMTAQFGLRPIRGGRSPHCSDADPIPTSPEPNCRRRRCTSGLKDRGTCDGRAGTTLSRASPPTPRPYFDTGPLTREPRPWTLDPGPWTLDPKLGTRDPGPETLDPRP